MKRFFIGVFLLMIFLPFFILVKADEIDDINNAIRLGLLGSDLERKKVRDLYQIEERRAARRIEGTLAPIGLPGVGKILATDWEKLPVETRAYAYAMHLRQQNGQPLISPEQFKLQANPSDMERLARAAGNDKELMENILKIKQAGATRVDFGSKAALQEQTNTINNWTNIGTPKYRRSLIPTKEEYHAIEDRVDNSLSGKKVDNATRNSKVDDEMTAHKLMKFESDLISAGGKKISGPKWDPIRKLFVWIFINPLGKEEEKTIER